MATLNTRRAIAVIALIGFSLSLVAHGATFFGINLSSTFPWIWGLHIGIFPLFFLLLASSGTLRWNRRISWKIFLAPMPRRTQIVVIGFFIYAIVNFALFFYLSQGGTPTIRDGNYILQNHGSFIRELTESEYRWQQAYILRGFSGHWMFFYLIPAMYFWYPGTTSTNITGT